MSDAFTIRTRKFMTNRLLKRKQMILDVFHPGRANVPRSELAQSLSESFKVPNPQTIVLFGFKTAFGGGKSTGFALIYDSAEDRKAAEPRYRFVRDGLEKKIEKSRKQIKELKNRRKKVRGKKKVDVGAGGKKK
eukprot:TRINITY_DN5087_c0_g1_i1.p3 TRINITY_DN5087_c0_g1~~TRINITY_DN5087_c0_g1_i1.p3  ORF type:complete len:134 (+),score=49.26 TRINITY_DN5087_c0_g1_i1:815-1216(+)